MARAPLALLIEGDKAPRAPLARAAAAQTRFVRRRGQSYPVSLPEGRVVLVRGRAADAELAAALEKLRARYPRRAFYLLAPEGLDAAERELWSERIDGVFEAPVGPGPLEALAAERERCVRAELGRGRASRRVALLEHRLVLLSDTIQAAGALLDPRMVSHFIMERAARLVGSSRWRLYRVDEAAGLLRLDAWADDAEQPRPAAEMPLEAGLAGWTARYRQVSRLPRASDDERIDRVLEWPGRAPGLLLAVPLVSRGRIIGVAELADPEGTALPIEDAETVHALMEPASIALDNAQLFRKLEERTVTDDLTQLYNARFMENYLRREAKRASRYGHPVSLLFLDLDGFKQVNDVHGHMAGSRTLVEVGQILRENVRDIDIVARWGGDEFTVVLPETERRGAEAMAERICRMIREASYLGELGLEIRLSASIGVASWPENGPSAATLLAAADAAMYHVKYTGKNGVFLAPPTGSQVPTPV